MSAPARIVTLKEIAARAQLSLATVSYALRNDPKIPAGTRAQVAAIAHELGYRPNPRVASLMAHIRRAHGRTTGERIAFVWVHTSREQAARDPFLQRVFRGARDRAEQMGFGLEPYWTHDRGMSDRRLQQILRARGITGVVLSPVTTSETTLTLDWDWSPFAAAVVGNVTWSPELHHAGHHHYLGMRTTLLELARLGCTRPAAILDHETNERAKRAWESAFLTHHPDPAMARACVRTEPAGGETAAAWIQASRPDALIVSATRLLELPGIRATSRKLALPVVTLDWNSETPELSGIDQGYDRIAGYAVDLVIAQLNSNESGAPDLPRIMLFPGKWVPPARALAAAPLGAATERS